MQEAFYAFYFLAKSVAQNLAMQAGERVEDMIFKQEIMLLGAARRIQQLLRYYTSYRYTI